MFSSMTTRRLLATLACLPLLSSCSYFDHLNAGEPFIPDIGPGMDVVDDSATAEKPPLRDQGLPVSEGAILPPRDAWDECPYLNTKFVEDTNGQHVLGVGLDTRFETPACVYWSYGEAFQLQVLVRHFNTEEEAIATVDNFAPIDWTSPASKPTGWDGGRGNWDAGSVYAVHKDTTAVVVLSNQTQSIKPATVAEETIKNLGL